MGAVAEYEFVSFDDPIDMYLEDGLLKRWLVRLSYNTVGSLLSLTDRELDELGRKTSCEDDLYRFVGAVDRAPKPKPKLKEVVKLSFLHALPATPAFEVVRDSWALRPTSEGALRGASCRAPEVAAPSRSIDDAIKERLSNASNSDWCTDSFDGRRAKTEMPRTDWANELKQLDMMADGALESLKDRGDEALICMCFPAFAGGFEAVEGIFQRAFASSASQRQTFYTMADWFPDALLLYMVWAFRKYYKDGASWQPIFGVLGITESNVQSEIKDFLFSRIGKLGLSLYSPDESDFYYHYTMLLHAGLSKEIWEDLWESTLLKIAIQGDSDWDCPTAAWSGHRILRVACDPTSMHHVSTEGAHKVLEKMPSGTAEPLLERALAVASDVVRLGKRKASTNVSLLAQHGLTDVALDALVAVLRKDAKEAPSASILDEATEVIYLPEATVCLESGEGDWVGFDWDRLFLPGKYAGYELTYEVMGEVRHRESLVEIEGRCEVDPVHLRVAPAPDLLVELHVRRPSDGEQEETEESVSFISQRVVPTRPGVYEFLFDGVSRYVLRSKTRRIHRERQVAYLVLPGYSVEAVAGMELVSKSEVYGTPGFTIAYYNIVPGAQGRILGSDGQAVAVWHESYRTSSMAGDPIGTDARGNDLYGCREYKGLYSTLPTFLIEMPTGGVEQEPLRVECLCDGCEIPLYHRDLSSANDYEGAVSTFVIDLKRSSIPTFVRSGQLKAFAKDGSQVLLYRFCVAPVAEVHLAGLSIEDDCIMATYRFNRVSDGAEVAPDGEPWSHLNPGYSFKRPLEDISARFEFRGPEEEGATASVRPLEAVLHLAGIRVALPELTRQNGRRFNLFDATERKGRSDRITVTALARRRNRGVYISVGRSPLIYGDNEAPWSSMAHMFGDLSAFMPPEAYRENLPAEPERVALRMSVGFGTESSADSGWVPVPAAARTIEIQDFETGFGFTLCKVERIAIGWLSSSMRVRFEPAFDRALCVRLRDDQGNKSDVIQIEAGAQTFDVPTPFAEQLFGRHRIWASFASKARLRAPDFSVSQSIVLCKGARG